jgi:hypothetical protein
LANLLTSTTRGRSAYRISNLSDSEGVLLLTSRRALPRAGSAVVFYVRRTASAGIRLPPKTEPLDDSPIARNFGVTQVVEKPTSLTDHLEKTTAGMVILLVRPQVLGELINAPGKDCDLHFRGARIGFVGLEILNNLLLSLSR